MQRVLEMDGEDVAYQCECTSYHSTVHLEKDYYGTFYV